MRDLIRVIAATLPLLAFPVVASAHHSVAGFFDPNEQVEIEGVVTSMRWGNPEVIVEGPYLQGILGGRSYDISLDGEQFLMLATITDASAAPQIVIVQNWVEELKRLVPTE